MWITQTYLGTVEPEANVYVYYLYEDYVNNQLVFTEKVQRSFEKLGDTYNADVTLLMPNPRYADTIESEVRENRPLWMHIKGALPGLLVSTVPLVNLEKVSADCYFVPFDTKQDSLGVAKTILEARKLIDKTLNAKFTNRDHQVKSIYRKIGEAVELKPGLFGFRIDVKKLFT